eukprot:TRINITY_DN2904_c0_g1_i6.p1 TRINITY_DN2904_c0_g1~~TRINITY_DN2904_c0_g1_i6.p1  ORF type:complete len:223 (-),score=11.16 TRINITY_DN2904_c0_g1_i6:151-819(-)
MDNLPLLSFYGFGIPSCYPEFKSCQTTAEGWNSCENPIETEFTTPPPRKRRLSKRARMFSDTGPSLIEDQQLQPASRKTSCTQADFEAKYKTEMCKYWEQGTDCPFEPNCAFAHGCHELRDKTTNSTKCKTKKCKQFHTYGFCPYGKRCQFLHNETSPFRRYFETRLLLDSAGPIYSGSEKLLSPRLAVFDEITSLHELSTNSITLDSFGDSGKEIPSSLQN